MKQPPRQRTIKDERDEKIGKDAKVYAFEWIIAITQVLTIMCIIKGNPAWKGTISILFFGVAFLLFYEFKQYEGKTLQASWNCFPDYRDCIVDMVWNYRIDNPKCYRPLLFYN